MTVYRLENVELIFQDKNVKASADLMRSTDGKDPWVLVEPIATTVAESKEASEIAEAVEEYAKSIARKDNIVNDVLAQAKAMLEGAVVEL